MKLQKLTTLLVVDQIESCLPDWSALGYEVAVRVPDTGPLDFVILKSHDAELMLQTKRSLAEDLPTVAARQPATVFYADVRSLTEAKSALRPKEVLVAERKTFYGATESWVALENGTIVGFAQHA
jgi:hypothetical protein